MGLAEHVFALHLHLGGEIEQHRHRGQEHARRLPRPARPDEPADRLGEVQRRRCAGGVDADGKPRHVHALGNHPHRHHPRGRTGGEIRDPRRRSRVVGQHQRGGLTGNRPQQFRVRTRVGLVGGDDEAARVGHAGAAQLTQPGVRRAQHRRDPVTVRVERGTPRPRGVLGAQRLTQPRRELLTGAVAPARLTRVREEHDRPHDPVGEGLGVPVGVVGARTRQPVAVRFVGDERDRRVVAAERRTGQREPPRRGLERLPDRVAPALRVAAVMDLVEDHQGAAILGAHAVSERMRGDLRVRDDDTVIVRRRLSRRVRETRIEFDTDPRRRRRPLVLEMLGRRDDGHRVDRPVGEQFGGDLEREGGFARAGSRDRQEVPRRGGQVLGQRAGAARHASAQEARLPPLPELLRRPACRLRRDELNGPRSVPAQRSTTRRRTGGRAGASAGCW